MKFNIGYFGFINAFHLRRDFLLALKYGLEGLGHDVILSGMTLSKSRFNLIVGAYFLEPGELRAIARSGVEFAHVNTEVIANDTLNFDPAKTDFLGAYLPSMKAGRFVWDVIMDNLAEHRRYGTNAHFLRWGWHPKLEDIEHRAEKDLDFYLFGMMSKRRKAIVRELLDRRLTGLADDECPYFLRNDRIARARVNLNVVQEDRYTHVNSFRICYLANNRGAIVSEAESDPAGYLQLTRIAKREELADAIRELCDGDKWKSLGEAAYERFRAQPMTGCLEELLEASFGGRNAELAGAAHGAG